MLQILLSNNLKNKILCTHSILFLEHLTECTRISEGNVGDFRRGIYLPETSHHDYLCSTAELEIFLKSDFQD